MGLTLVTGRANTGKTGVVYEVIRAAVDEGQRPSLLLPTRPDVLRATAELAATRPLGVLVAQLDQWVAEQWSLLGDGRRIVSPEQRIALIGEAARAAGLRSLAHLAAAPGFRATLAHVAQKASEEPREVLDQDGGAGAVREVRAVLRRYHESLDAAGLIEPGEATRALACLPPPADSPVVLHRFSDLTRAQERLVVALSSAVGVWVTLPWEQGFPATEAVTPLIERLSDGATLHHCSVTQCGDELSRFEDGLFRTPEPAAISDAVSFCTAAGDEAEAALIAERAALAASRYGADRVAIVFRDARGHVARTRVALAGAGVPADLDVLVPAGSTPFGVALRQVLSAAAGDRVDLAAFLHGPFSGVSGQEAGRLDASWRRGRVDGHHAMSEAQRRADFPTARILRLASRVTGARLGGVVKDWQELADGLLGCAAGRPEALGAETLEDAAAHRALVHAVQHLAELGDPRMCDDEVMAAFEGAMVSTGSAERRGHLQVTEAHRLRSRRFDAVIIGGLTADDFSPEGRVDPAARLAERVLGVGGRDIHANERLLFYDVCTRARRELVLVRKSSDSEGRAVRASVLWEEALDLYRPADADADDDDRSVVSDSIRLDDMHRAAPALAPDRRAKRAIAASGEGGGIAPEIRGVIGAWPRSGPRRLLDRDLLDQLAAREVFSATELESYARCPYRWFYERVVRPGALDAVVDARMHGSIAHRALAAFYEQLPVRLGRRRVTEDIVVQAVDLAGRAFDQAAAAAAPAGSLTLAESDDLATMKRRVEELVTADATFLEGYEPLLIESRFGLPGSPEAPDAAGGPNDPGPVDFGGFALRGSIDRVDAGPEGIVVIDYKSGSVPTGAKLLEERHLQVGLYAAVAERVTGRPVVAGLYRSIRDGAARGFWLKGVVPREGLTSTDSVEDPADVARAIADAVTAAREAVAGIRAGDIPAQPATDGACGHCAAAAICAGRG